LYLGVITGTTSKMCDRLVASDVGFTKDVCLAKAGASQQTLDCDWR